MLALLLAAGAPVAPGVPGADRAGELHYTLAHNPAAFVGVGLCLLLLALWFDQEAEETRKRIDGLDQSDPPVDSE